MRKIAGLAFGLALIVACAPPPAPSPTAAPQTPAPVSLVVSYSQVVPDNLALWVAKEGGYFDRNGLNVELKYIASATGIAALLAGETTIFNGGGSETLSAVVGGADLVALANMVPVYPFLFEVGPDIHSIDQVRGLKIGVSSIGASGDIATRAGLRREGLDPSKDVSIVAVGSVQNMVSALLNGSVQAIISRPPDSVTLEAKGFHPLFDLAEQKLPSVNVCVVVQRAFLEAHRDTMQRYIDAVVAGLTRVRQDRAFAVEVLKKYYKSTDDAAMQAAYDYHVTKVFPSAPTLEPAHFGDSVDQLSQNDPRIRELDLNKLIDNSLVNSAVERGLAR